jgi:hypothetical protein
MEIETAVCTTSQCTGAISLIVLCLFVRMCVHIYVYGMLPGLAISLYYYYYIHN